VRRTGILTICAVVDVESVVDAVGFGSSEELGMWAVRLRFGALARFGSDLNHVMARV
jgi:hypothetical protein